MQLQRMWQLMQISQNLMHVIFRENADFTLEMLTCIGYGPAMIWAKKCNEAISVSWKSFCNTFSALTYAIDPQHVGNS